jgi:hypothetical protein
MSWGWFLNSLIESAVNITGGAYQMMITYFCDIQFFVLDKSVMTMTKD